MSCLEINAAHLGTHPSQNTGITLAKDNNIMLCLPFAMMRCMFFVEANKV